ncbi:MAG TPA: ATP synthase F0 subunit B [Acidobacteriota bacterium]|nr:ATP synthase F0 subunit B [Acidobacteriota bacterium]
MLSVDWTLLASGLIFLFTLWALNRVLFKPLFQVLDQRKAQTVDLQAEASAKLDYYSRLVDEYEERIKQEKQQGYQEAEKLRQEALEIRQQKLIEARNEAAGLLEKARQQIEAETEAARERLQRDSEELAATIATRILAR